MCDLVHRIPEFSRGLELQISCRRSLPRVIDVCITRSSKLCGGIASTWQDETQFPPLLNLKCRHRLGDSTVTLQVEIFRLGPMQRPRNLVPAERICGVIQSRIQSQSGPTTSNSAGALHRSSLIYTPNYSNPLRNLLRKGYYHTAGSMRRSNTTIRRNKTLPRAYSRYRTLPALVSQPRPTLPRPGTTAKKRNRSNGSLPAWPSLKATT
jgi:hypothetical protein